MQLNRINNWDTTAADMYNKPFPIMEPTKSKREKQRGTISNSGGSYTVCNALDSRVVKELLRCNSRT